MPRHFEQLITDAIAAQAGPDKAPAVAQTMISTSIGLKHQVRGTGLPTASAS